MKVIINVLPRWPVVLVMQCWRSEARARGRRSASLHSSYRVSSFRPDGSTQSSVSPQRRVASRYHYWVHARQPPWSCSFQTRRNLDCVRPAADVGEDGGYIRRHLLRNRSVANLPALWCSRAMKTTAPRDDVISLFTQTYLAEQNITNKCRCILP